MTGQVLQFRPPQAPRHEPWITKQQLAKDLGCSTRFLNYRMTEGLPRAVRKDYGREDLDLYELRHFAAHLLYVRMGLPARVVAVQLGHRDGGRLVEQLYGHGDVHALDELKEAWAANG